VGRRRRESQLQHSNETFRGGQKRRTYVIGDVVSEW